MCSAVIICSIYYIVGLNDPLPNIGSQVIIHFFDGCVIIYLIAFPLICIFFHPDMQCNKKKRLKI